MSMAAFRRVIQLGLSTKSGIRFNYNVRRYCAFKVPVATTTATATAAAAVTFRADGSRMDSGRSSSPDSRPITLDCRQISKPNGKRVSFADVLALVSSLEQHGVPRKQAEAIIAVMSGMLTVAQEEMQKEHDDALLQHKNEHDALLQHKTEKLQMDIEKILSEHRRMRDELSNQNASLTNRLDQVSFSVVEINSVGKAAKDEVIKYCICTIIAILAVGLAILRILS